MEKTTFGQKNGSLISTMLREGSDAKVHISPLQKDYHRPIYDLIFEFRLPNKW
jgi:hypothetical protein